MSKLGQFLFNDRQRARLAHVALKLSKKPKQDFNYALKLFLYCITAKHTPDDVANRTHFKTHPDDFSGLIPTESRFETTLLLWNPIHFIFHRYHRHDRWTWRSKAMEMWNKIEIHSMPSSIVIYCKMRHFFAILISELWLAATRIAERRFVW